MTDLKLHENINRLIVDGIQQGYKDYLEVRRSAVEKYDLKVSSAYSWIKGNHIDSSVNKECSNNEMFSSEVKIAGTSWEYIQFYLKNLSEKYMLIIKNSSIKDKIFNGKVDKKKKNNYLYGYAGINNKFNDDIRNKEKLPHNTFIQMTIPEFADDSDKNKAEEDLKNYDRFYVVTYEIDKNTQRIKRITLCMPSQEMVLHEIDDLTPLIANSKVIINDDELEIAKDDKFPNEEYPEQISTFGYEKPKKSQEDTDK
ncbi:hypothetical protein PT287_01935 [Lactobacillus sp. ESL0679]|uniref:spr1630 family ClpXP-sensitive toxin n=1 Tax=Lactobacillus sp. ESL0679 TaxID=2983209 RepID=UPI0023F6F6F5|nr:hypothetical protein [Lactobacillus sp. ESL0679]MDF7682282.1 hypothetical protein [Lactobacillus sp. ESL0679]